MLIAIAFCSFNSFSQTAAGTDTLNGGETLYFQTPLNYFSGNNGVWTASITATKVSGTSEGWATLEVSADGINYVPLTSTAADSFQITNVTDPQVKIWFVDNNRVNKARVKVVSPAGTQATLIKGYYLKN